MHHDTVSCGTHAVRIANHVVPKPAAASKSMWWLQATAAAAPVKGSVVRSAVTFGSAMQHQHAYVHETLCSMTLFAAAATAAAAAAVAAAAAAAAAGP
jgi:hypothetical protein